jgi:hypothetical protein
VGVTMMWEVLCLLAESGGQAQGQGLRAEAAIERTGQE